MKITDDKWHFCKAGCMPVTAKKLRRLRHVHKLLQIKNGVGRIAPHGFARKHFGRRNLMEFGKLADEWLQARQFFGGDWPA